MVTLPVLTSVNWCDFSHISLHAVYPVAGQDFSGTDNECTFPCRVETIDGSPLTLTPHLIWAKKRDQDLADTIEDLPDEPFVDLRDPYWYEVELTGFSKDYECRLVELQDKVYYNCDYVEKNCHYVVHSGEYKCILTNLHEDRIYSHVIHYNGKCLYNPFQNI